MPTHRQRRSGRGGDPLARYRGKRDLAASGEPSDAQARDSTDGDAFVIRRHDASNLHFDFRLQVGDVLASWAVPNGPSTDPGDKRLAVRTEDHPLGYADFEGEIPQGQYGAGTVIVWDAGRYRNLTEADGEPVDMPAALAGGHVKVWLDGQKVAGAYALTHTRMRGDERNWLLVKVDDEKADRRRRPATTSPGSVRSGRTNDDLRGTADTRTVDEILSAEAAAALRPAAQMSWRSPMLATLTDRRFSSPDWVFERKLDGVRALVTAADGRVRLWSRNHNDVTASYPELASALGRQAPPRFVADGEIVAFDGGQTSFARLQARIHLSRPAGIARAGVAVYLYLFDLLALGDVDLTGLSLRDRKRILAAVVDFGATSSRLRYSAHRNADGEAYYRYACEHGWEGLIAKRAAAPYRSGRSSDWLKFKCVRGQEFVIGGFTDPQGSRAGFGALLVGYHDDTGRLCYAGKVGTGFDRQTLTDLRSRLDGLTQTRSPFREPVREPGAHWVSPRLVAQVGFSEWTRGGRLRHPRFEGLRTDKPAGDVVRERE